MKRLILIFILGYLCSSSVITGAETYTLNKCIEIALESHPDIKVSKANLKNANYNIIKTVSSFYPQLSASGSYRYSQNIQPFESSSSNYSAGVSLSQNLYDFGRTGGRVRAAGENKNYNELVLKEKVQGIILNVTQRYYEYLKAKRILEADSESLRQSEEHLTQAQDFFKSGIRPRIEVTKAEVQKANDKLALINALNSLKIAKLRLANSMGMDHMDFEVEDAVDTQAFDISLRDCIQQAFKSRPEILEMESKVKSAQLNLAIARSSFLPAISASGSWNYSGSEFPLENSSWSAGVNISIPLFTGFSTLSEVKTARENLEIAIEQKKNCELSIRLEVEQAYLTAQEKRESIEVAASGLKNATENFMLAHGRYMAGVGSMIELTDAQVSLTRAKVNYINSMYDYAISLANLKKAAGMLNYNQ